MSFKTPKDFAEYERMVNEWTEIRKELNDKVIESKLGEQVTQEDPTLKTLQNIQKSLTKTQVDNFGEPVRNVSTGEKIETSISDLIENVLKNVSVTNPNSGPARILNQLRHLNTTSDEQKIINVHTNRLMKGLRKDLEEINKSIVMSSIQKDVVLNFYEKVFDFQIGNKLTEEQIGVIQSVFEDDMLKQGVSKISLETLMEPINRILLTYTDEEITDELAKEILSKINNKLNKSISEEQLTRQFENLGELLRQIIKSSIDVEKSVVLTADALQQQVEEQASKEEAINDIILKNTKDIKNNLLHFH